MALYVRDPEVDRLVSELAQRRRQSKTDVVRQALANELERERGKPSLVEVGLGFCRDLRLRGDARGGKASDRAFVDSLYEDG